MDVRSITCVVLFWLYAYVFQLEFLQSIGCRMKGEHCERREDLR